MTAARRAARPSGVPNSSFSFRGHHHANQHLPERPWQHHCAAPSIFATGKHVSRSDRYSYIPPSEVLRGLQREGFEPFMLGQSKSRIEGKTEFTKHMIRMRHVGSASTQQARPEANEIILINSHDGASSYDRRAASTSAEGKLRL